MKHWIYNFFLKLLAQANAYHSRILREKYHFDKTVKLSDTSLVGNIAIDKYTYANNGCTFSSGAKSKVIIGKYCAIGRYVHITSKGHDLRYPTSDENNVLHKHVEGDTTIGDYVWIGDHVFVKHGITIGDYAVIAANAVVTKDVKPFEIVGGVPAKHIRFNTEHYKYKV